MKISEKQLQLMFVVLSDSVRVDISRIFTFDRTTREDLWKIILEQQADELKDIDEKTIA